MHLLIFCERQCQTPAMVVFLNISSFIETFIPFGTTRFLSLLLLIHTTPCDRSLHYPGNSTVVYMTSSHNIFDYMRNETYEECPLRLYNGFLKGDASSRPLRHRVVFLLASGGFSPHLDLCYFCTSLLPTLVCSLRCRVRFSTASISLFFPAYTCIS